MPNARQRRDTARRKFERQQDRRQAAVAKQRRIRLIALGAVALIVLIGGGIWGAVVVFGGKDDAKPAASASSPSTSCEYKAQTTENPNSVDVGLPPEPQPMPQGSTVPLNITTNQGDLTIDLDPTTAPCNVQSISYLASKKFFNNTHCHRLVTNGIFVLQCGDPSATGSGGPKYQVKDENLSTADYREGTVAMANSGPNTNGSQFFIIYQDSNAGLAKKYTVIGHVSKGLDAVKKVAAAGTKESTADGPPKTDFIFQHVSVGKS